MRSKNRSELIFVGYPDQIKDYFMTLSKKYGTIGIMIKDIQIKSQGGK